MTSVATERDGAKDGTKDGLDVGGEGWSPLAVRVYGALPGSPLWVGLGFSGLTLAVVLLATWLAGELSPYIASERSLLDVRDARLALVLCALVGFLPTAQVLMLRFTRENLRALAPALGQAPAPLRLPKPSFWRHTLPSLLVVPLIAFSIDRDLRLYLDPAYLAGPIHWFQWSVGFFVTFQTARLAHLSATGARTLGARAAELRELDLLDLGALAPFARQSLQIALTWLLMLSLFSVNLVDPGFAVPVVLIGVFCGLNLIAGVAHCHRGLHARIRAAKQRESQLINAALRGDADAAARLRIRAPAGALSPADLLAYRSFVQQVSEWAFDASSWLRAVLYLAIPLGSWLGGAVVERILDSSLG
ncbi:MAG: hypothetical protein MJE66_19105 [Proteobacteria bacterium]|nr:hypothetical protein [Pseudomonadota bacterium]